MFKSARMDLHLLYCILIKPEICYLTGKVVGGEGSLSGTPGQQGPPGEPGVPVSITFVVI